LPKILNSISSSPDLNISLTKFNNITYRMSKVLKFWLINLEKLNPDSVGDVENGFVQNLIKLWTKLVDYMRETYSKVI
jgi:hypothetical protein